MLQRFFYRLRRRLNRPRLVSVDELFETTRVHHWDTVFIDAPEAPDLPLVPRAAEFRQSKMKTPPIFSCTIQDVLLCTTNNVLMKSPRRVVAESYEPWEATRPASRFRSPFDANLCHVRPEDEVLSGVCTMFRSIRKSYSHMLLENIGRISLLHHPAYAEHHSIDVIIDDPLTPTEAYLVERLLPDNCVIKEVKPRSVYRVERFILLSHVTYRDADGQHPEYIDFLQSKVLPKRPSRRTNRILISRRASPRGRKMLNVDDVTDLLAEFGFREQQLENLSIGEQIELFHDAEAVVAAHGAGLSNLLFAPRGTRVIELFGTRDIVPHYYFLSRSLGHVYSNILGDRSNLDDDFEVDLDVLRTQLGSLSKSAR
jgi:capsular polysaccharide biosynthesis protein